MSRMTPARAAARKAATLARAANEAAELEYYNELANENPTGYVAGQEPWNTHNTPEASAVSNEPFFPQVHVKLQGEDGNGFMIVARVRKALRTAGLQGEAEKFTAEATAGDYDHLLQTCFKYVTVR